MNFYCQAGYKSSSDQVFIYFAPRNPTTGDPIAGWSSTGKVYLDIIATEYLASNIVYDAIIHDQEMTTLTMSAAPYLSNTMWTTCVAKSVFVKPVSGGVYAGQFLLVFKNEDGGAPSKWLYGLFNMTARAWIEDRGLPDELKPLALPNFLR